MKVASIKLKKILGKEIELFGEESHLLSLKTLEEARTKIWYYTTNNPMPINQEIILLNIGESELPFSTNERLVIKVSEPRTAFLSILKELFCEEVIYEKHQTALILPYAKVDHLSRIGPYSYIGKSVIGENTIIEGNCIIYDDVEIGKNCRILAGAVIGIDSFGYEKSRSGEWIKYPQIGKVLILNNVEIGANSCIHKGILEDTVIYNNVKIDSLCSVGYGVTLKENTIITGGVSIAGNVRIGKNCWVGPNAFIRENVSIGDDCFIGAGSIVIRNIKSRKKVFGNPATEI